MDRVTQYSDLWAGLAGETELLYAFEAGGFFSHREPPTDIPGGKPPEDLGHLPAISATEDRRGRAQLRGRGDAS